MSAKVPRLLELEVSSVGMTDWASLQTDIVGIIIKKLAIPDYIRLRAVCTSWNRVCKDVSNYPRVDPWLMLPANPLDGSKFFSIPEKKNQIISIPSTASFFGTIWTPVGSSHGWLIYFCPSHGIMRLVNPISSAQIQLPPTERMPVSKAMLLDMNERNFTVAVIYRNQKGYRVTRKGNNSWSWVDSEHTLVDVFKHRRQLYTINIYGTVEVWAEPPRAWPDEDQLHQNFVHYPSQRKFNCLVETLAGDLIRIKQQSQNKFALWILDKETFSWVRTNDIGEFGLFVSHYSSICFPAKNHPNLKSNCVYFIDAYNNLCVFNLEYGTKEFVEALETVHARGQHSLWRQPEELPYIWFIPSLE